MTETAADNEYFAAAEAAFIRRRGTPFLLSPRDFSLLREWRALGVPLEAIEQGIDDAFSLREERAATGRVNSLWYCRDAVLSAWERRAEASAGRGGARTETATDSAPLLDALEQAMAGVAARRPDLHDPLDAAQRSIARLRKSERDPASLEVSLARLDKKLASALYAALPEPERDALDDRVRRALEPARARMDDATAEKTTRALTRRAVRERLDLPRLTLLT
jgi:hypothetical protein